jgi:hypothetical protein
MLVVLSDQRDRFESNRVGGMYGVVASCPVFVRRILVSNCVSIV